MSSQQVFSDRYELVNHIARGGMAQVYLAKDVLLDRPVALKVLFPELSVDRAFVERFRREARAAANLTHPNIVSVYDWGQGERTYFIVMEYVDGQTLSRLLRDGALDPVRAATIGADVAAALEFAHRRGVIHRDIKPGNVLIDSSGRVKVADFGIARAIGASEDLTQTGSVMGTATYFSPEQAQGHTVDVRSDVYSLGVVLYEMVTGKAPFSGDSPVAIAYKHVKEEPVPPTALDPTIPAGYEAIVLKALAKNAADRYQTAEELRADLLRFAAGQPVAAEVEATRVGAAVGATAAMAATGVMGMDATRVQNAPGATTALPRTMTGGAGGPGSDAGRRSRGPLVAVIVLLLLAIIAAAVFFIGRSEGWWDSTASATIPASVVNQTQAAATSQLQALGFSHIAVTDRPNNSIKKGNVITTEPAPGTREKTNQTITLAVSSGRASVTVPNVAGDTQQAATTQLKDAGFNVTATPQASSSVQSGYVISTNPAVNTSQPAGTTIQLVVSSGPQTVNVPTMTGDSPLVAGQQLGAINLKVASEQNQPSKTVDIGLVTGTDPPAGTAVALNSSVVVYVSSGISVPNISGMTVGAASAELNSAGLSANFNDANSSDVISSQSPAAGTPVNPGTAVSGTATAPTTTTPTTTTTVPSTTTTASSVPGST
jgi:serine/threonine-protein kinase